MNPLDNNSTTGSQLNLDEFQNRQQNLLIAFIAGSVAMLVSAIIWAVVTTVTGYQIGWMAIGVGFLVGLAVRLGKGVDNIYRYLGAGLALIGCLLGNFFTIVGFISQEEKVNAFSVLGLIDYTKIPSLMMTTASPIDLLFYAFAIYQGYKISVRTDAVETPPSA